MQIVQKNISIRALVEDYLNDDVEGVVGYANNLDIRPQYQRAFVYKDAQDVPRYEVMDGQQRTISICEYVAGSYAVDDKYFHTLPEDQAEQLLSYKLFVYVCSDTESEKTEGHMLPMRQTL